MARSRPLPGIRFEIQAPPSGDVLPRMDIPAFVGFAASGPIHQPVAVEDAAQFEMIFGAALPLAREAGTSVPVEAYLAPTVRAFFRNGGRRCWIVRVAREADPGSGTALEQEGLAKFDADLFLDPGLRDATVRDLLERADFIRYQSSDPRPLTGIHAVLGLDEVTLVAVPDAVHRGWLRAGAPALSSPPASSPLDHPEWWRWLDCNAPSPKQPLAAGVPLGGGGFIDCDVVAPVAAPVLTATAPAGGTYELLWTPADLTDPTHPIDILQEATRPDFSDAADIAFGTPGRVTIYGRDAGDFFYRVRRQVGARTSDWSNGIGIHVESAAGWTSVAPADYLDQTLVDVHTALVTMCAARGDLVGILSLPMHYDERRALAHTTKLALGSRVLSYGALWHPWLILRDGPDGDAAPLKAIPPDGATAGVIAARALGRGAWIAPANEPLRGPVALTPAIAAASRQALQDAAVNLIRQEPGGFVCLDADTLSPDDEVRPLNVRRLLALVRRAALRVGNDYAFEPNDGAARRAVRRAFESMLETLFVRGAFAGRTEQSSFQVVTDDSLNPPSSIDAGRLIAEIRIAPSRPLSFLTIRLVQAGDATVLQEATP